MKRTAALVLACCLFAVGCSGSADQAGTTQGVLQTCAADDPSCGAAVEEDLPGVVALTDPDDPNAKLQVDFSGFFYSDGTNSQLCSALAESSPPQCASVVIDISAPLDVVLANVAESLGNKENANINIVEGVYWTNDWVNLTGTLQANRLVLE